MAAFIPRFTQSCAASGRYPKNRVGVSARRSDPLSASRFGSGSISVQLPFSVSVRRSRDFRSICRSPLMPDIDQSEARHGNARRGSASVAIRRRTVQRSRVTQHLARTQPRARSEGRLGTNPFAFFACQSSLLRHHYPTMTREPPARQAPRQSARFLTANKTKNANRPVAARAPREAFDLWTQVARPNAMSLWSVSGEH